MGDAAVSAFCRFLMRRGGKHRAAEDTESDGRRADVRKVLRERVGATDQYRWTRIKAGKPIPTASASFSPCPLCLCVSKSRRLVKHNNLGAAERRTCLREAMHAVSRNAHRSIFGSIRSLCRQGRSSGVMTLRLGLRRSGADKPRSSPRNAETSRSHDRTERLTLARSRRCACRRSSERGEPGRGSKLPPPKARRQLRGNDGRRRGSGAVLLRPSLFFRPTIAARSSRCPNRAAADALGKAALRCLGPVVTGPSGRPWPRFRPTAVPWNSTVESAIPSAR